MEFLKEHYQEELDRLSLKLPAADRIPRVRFTEAKRLVSEKYGRSIRNPHDLEPEEEQLISRYFLEEYGAEFVFVTHYPSKKRPFYAMDDPEDPRYTLSFDLLFRGVEVTTGGQRIHDYKALTRKIADRGMTEEGLEFYLDAFRYGMPPHGGLGIGLERLTMQLLGAENVREACLFPRDMNLSLIHIWIAYVLDENNELYKNMNKAMISIEKINNKYDEEELREMIEAHVRATGSKKGKEILENYAAYLPRFKKLIPNEYQKMLLLSAKLEEKGLTAEQAQMEAFYESAGVQQ